MHEEMNQNCLNIVDKTGHIRSLELFVKIELYFSQKLSFLVTMVILAGGCQLHVNFKARYACMIFCK